MARQNHDPLFTAVDLASAREDRDLGHGGGAAVSSGYGAPTDTYGAPSSGYGAPSAAGAGGYAAPSGGYAAPSGGYGAPCDSYGTRRNLLNLEHLMKNRTETTQKIKITLYYFVHR